MEPLLRLDAERRRRTVCFALVCIAALVAYAHSFDAAFQFDDYDQILGNRTLTTPTFAGLVGWARTRVVPFATFALNFWAGGDNPVGYHVVNFLIHLLASLAVFQLALAACRTPRVRATALAERPLVFATAAAIVFACHPIQVQAVTYIVQRISSMAAMFYVASVLLYVRARGARGAARGWGYVGSGALAVGAFLSKENGATLPLAILLAEIVFFGVKGLARKVLRVAPFLVLILAIPIAWKLYPHRKAPKPAHEETSLGQQADDLVHMLTWAADPLQGISSPEYFLTQCVVVPRYLGLVFAPWGFTIDHDVPVRRELSPVVVCGLLGLAILFGFGLYAAKRWPVIGFGILWTFIALGVESSVFPIQDVMNEHRMYLAMPGVSLVVAGLFTLAVRRRPALSFALGGAVAVLLCALTAARNEVWRTQLSLWSDALEKSPEKARVYVNVGTALQLEGRLDEAIPYYCRALEIEPKNPRANYHLQVVLDQKVDDGTAAMEVESVEADGTEVLVPSNPCPQR